MGEIIQNVSSVDRENRLITIWLRTYKSQATREHYSRVIRKFLKYANIGSIQEVKYVHINLFLTSIEGRWSAKTAALNRAALSSLFTAMVSYGYIKENPFSHVKKIKVKEEDIFRFLPAEVVSKIIETAEPGRNKALVKILYWTGMRISETLSLDLENFIVGYQRVDIVVTGKGNKTRKVTISKEKFDDIMSELKSEGEGLIVRNEPIFKSSRGSRLSRVQAWRIIKAISINAGVGNMVAPHWFRHSHVTNSLRNGAPLKAVQRNVGHESIKSTARYQHLADDEISSDYL